jgi:hypothetical protein
MAHEVASLVVFRALAAIRTTYFPCKHGTIFIASLLFAPRSGQRFSKNPLRIVHPYLPHPKARRGHFMRHDNLPKKAINESAPSDCLERRHYLRRSLRDLYVVSC